MSTSASLTSQIAAHSTALSMARVRDEIAVRTLDKALDLGAHMALSLLATLSPQVYGADGSLAAEMETAGTVIDTLV